MKKRIMVCAGMLVMGVVLQGCQNASTEEITANKGDDQMVQLIEKENSGQNLNIPEHFEDEFTNAANDVEIKIDADVFAETTELPAVLVTPHEISSEEVKLWAEVLFEGKTAYEPKTEMTKAELEEKINNFKKWKVEKLPVEYEGRPEELKQVQESYDKDIAGYEKMLKDAPESVEKRECDWEFYPYYYYVAERDLYKGHSDYESKKDMYQIQAVVDDLHGSQAKIVATNRDSDEHVMHQMCFYYENTMPDHVGNESISREEALKIAEELMNKLGLENWSVLEEESTDSQNKGRYKLYYVPSYTGIQTMEMSGYDLKDIGPEMNNPSLEITLDNGVVTEIWLMSPMDVIEVENSNVEMMDFEEAYTHFKEYAEKEFTREKYLAIGEPIEDLQEGNYGVYVDKITLGLWQVKADDNSIGYRVVPVWNFEGTTYLDELSEGTLRNNYKSICAVNAIDGSVVYRNLQL